MASLHETAATLTKHCNFYPVGGVGSACRNSIERGKEALPL
jgi:hypothetical protein